MRSGQLLALAFLPLAFLAAGPAASNAPPKPSLKPSLKKMAPADQYFGKLKLSFLGINNTFRDAAISAGPHTADPAIASKVDFALDALNDWQGKFPRDPQLARTYFLAQITLKKLWIQKYQDKAWSYMQHIVAAYPATFYGRTIKAEIARGFTQHYYAPAIPCAASASPAASEASPSPAPSVTVGNGKYKTVVETPPCITSSPSPSPTPSPTAEAPLASPSAQPSAAPSASAAGTTQPAAGVPSAIPASANIPSAIPASPTAPNPSGSISPSAVPVGTGLPSASPQASPTAPPPPAVNSALPLASPGPSPASTTR